MGDPVHRRTNCLLYSPAGRACIHLKVNKSKKDILRTKKCELKKTRENW